MFKTFRQTDRHYENNGHLAVIQLECGPMPNVMVALPNIGGATLCSTLQRLTRAHSSSAVQ